MNLDNTREGENVAQSSIENAIDEKLPDEFEDNSDKEIKMENARKDKNVGHILHYSSSQRDVKNATDEHPHDNIRKKENKESTRYGEDIIHRSHPILSEVDEELKKEYPEVPVNQRKDGEETSSYYHQSQSSKQHGMKKQSITLGYSEKLINKPHTEDRKIGNGESKIHNSHHSLSSTQHNAMDEQFKTKCQLKHSAAEHQAGSIRQPFKYQKVFRAELIDQMKATIYGQCIGDAIGLLTEFMTIEEAELIYGRYESLEYTLKYNDRHRSRWRNGDWTDDSDQMILIMQSLIESNGEVNPPAFACKMLNWIHNGFVELNDKGGCGIGRLTYEVTHHPQFPTAPFKAARDTWERTGRNNAPNGGVMRTSIMGLHEFWNVDKVKKNAVEFCKVTHYDERCQASVAAVSVAISLMLQSKEHIDNEKVEIIINKAFRRACEFLKDDNHKEEFHHYMFCKDLSNLELCVEDSIGYTFKCVGAGFWALRQADFRLALEQIVRNGGDADSNGAVAGALLGCKLGMESLPKTWLNDLVFKSWLDENINKYLDVLADNWTYSQSARKTETTI